MEDGALCLFGCHGGHYELLWRRRAHQKELREICFAPSSALVCTAAADGQCLCWRLDTDAGPLPEPTPISQPSFRMHRLMRSASSRSKRRSSAAQWRCIALPEPSAVSAASRWGWPLCAARPQLLLGALNHAGGPGWVARCDLSSGRVLAYARASANPLTALAAALEHLVPLVCVGSSEGELIVLHAESLISLRRLQVRSRSRSTYCR
jgi:hypothetical protein